MPLSKRQHMSFSFIGFVISAKLHHTQNNPVDSNHSLKGFVGIKRFWSLFIAIATALSLDVHAMNKSIDCLTQLIGL